MNNMKLNGLAHNTALFFQKEQLLDTVLWKKFVDVFRTGPDSENLGWKGEYYGKMMRGACLVYEYTKDEQLYSVLCDAARDMLTVAEKDGRVASYTREIELTGWDLWCRKYVILSLEYFIDICKDEDLKKRIIAFISGCADYIIAHVGNGEGQISINKATKSWLGLNSSSILEPIVKLYNLTDNQKYLDFATYIVNEGGCSKFNLVQLAYENKVLPYQYGVSKAYEMMSFFEGVLEYYLVTGNEKYKTAVLNFADAVIESEISVIGSCGITHELFDHTKQRQTISQDEVAQETCVTVTWMKLCSRLLQLTGDSKYADQMEKSFYNAYLGSINSELHINPIIPQYIIDKYGVTDVVKTFLPVDSYSPLIPGKRGLKTGGFQLMPDKSYYGCCACIASAGVGVFLKSTVTTDADGIVINFFEKGTADFEIGSTRVRLEIKTDYPADGKITVNVKCDKPTHFRIKVRVPDWTDNCGYKVFEQAWSDDEISLDYKMELKATYPETWETDVVYTKMATVDGTWSATPETVYHKKEDDDYVSLSRGPLTLAVDSRMGKDANSIFDFDIEGTLCDDRQIASGVPCIIKMKFKGKDGNDFYLVDYASAGKDWNTEIAAWLKTPAK